MGKQSKKTREVKIQAGEPKPTLSRYQLRQLRQFEIREG